MKTSIRSGTFDPQHYRRLWSEVEAADRAGRADDIYPLIGQITTGFEFCEDLMQSLLVSVSKDSAFMRTVHNNLNSRTARSDIIKDVLQENAPKRPSRHYKAVVDLYARHTEMGKKRDDVAHGLINTWSIDGVDRVVLQASPRIERKHVAGLPKTFYDVPRLEALVSDINRLSNDLMTEMQIVGERNLKQLARAHEQARARRDQKPDPRS